jgi:peptidoglycan/xylan/chitin deacetylase (PgdA/CDA1 family)
LRRVCKGTIYLTFDTGSQSQAELIADTLNRHISRPPSSWPTRKPCAAIIRSTRPGRPYWKARVAEGHVIGSHTFDHVVYAGTARMASWWSSPALATAPASNQLTQTVLRTNPARRPALCRTDRQAPRSVWRAPAGRTSPRLLEWAALRLRACGLVAGRLLGDELSSEKYPTRCC